MHRISCLAVMFIGAVTFLAQSAENLALRDDAVPIARVTLPTGGQLEDINIINNEATEGESYAGYDGANVAGEDWYGYTWPEQLFFDDIVFYEGTPSAAGGYWKSLTVQYTTDGTRWVEAGNVVISPVYDFSDDPQRPANSRYDLSFTGCLGTGVRIYGRPGGPCFYTSLAELEVYGTKPPVVCTRALPTSYQSGQNLAVSLALDVEAGNAPANLSLVELIPAGLTAADAGTGDTSQPGQITWSFGDGDVASQTLNYSLAVPGDVSEVINFGGTLSYPETPSQDITGCRAVAPSPVPPSGLKVSFDADAHLSWTPPPQEGILGYKVYRSEDGGDFADISGLILDDRYADHFVEDGKTYQYKVLCQNVSGEVSDLAASPASDPAGPSMLRRQFEDYDFEGGSFPGGESQRGYRADFRSDLDSTDFFYHSTTFPWYDETTPNAYRSSDIMAIPAFNAEEHYIGYTTPSDWWRYTLDVPEDGYVKIGVIRAASEGQAIIAFLWDEWDESQLRWVESHKGWFSFDTGGLSNWQVLPIDTPAFHASAGEHTLRIVLSSGNADFDYFGVGFEQPEPSRTLLFSEDFESFSPDNWTIFNGSDNVDAAWQLWSTTGDHLGYDSPDLPSMFGKYIISDGDLAGPTDLDLDEQLISREIDCTGYVGVTVEFGSNIKVDEYDLYYDQVYDLDIRTCEEGSESWSDWVNVFHRERADGNDPSPQFVDVSNLADRKKIKLRWRFWKTNYDYWWAIDDVRVTGELPAAEEGKILSLGITGGNISLTWEPFGTGYYRVQYTDDLTSGTWSDASGYLTGTDWTGEIPPGSEFGFYRVISAEPPTAGKILSIEVIGDAISLTWETFGTGSYRVQFTEDLTSGTWSDVSDSVSETSWAGAVTAETKFGFYRVISP